MAETETEKPFSEDDDMDALSLLACDADEHVRDAESTQKAFGALAELVGVFEKVSEHHRRIHDAPALIEQMRRLAQIMEDYYAAHPNV